MAVNCFDGAPRYDTDEVREALATTDSVPLVLCDARHRESVKNVLIADMAADGLVAVYELTSLDDTNDAVGTELLERVLSGLRRL